MCHYAKLRLSRVKWRQAGRRGSHLSLYHSGSSSKRIALSSRLAWTAEWVPISKIFPPKRKGMKTCSELGVLAQFWDPPLERHRGRGWVYTVVLSYMEINWSRGLPRKTPAKLTTFSCLSSRSLVTFCLIHCFSLSLNYNTNNERSGSGNVLFGTFVCFFFFLIHLFVVVFLT